MDRGDFTVFYSGSACNCMFGTEFLVNKKYKKELIGSEPESEKCCVLGEKEGISVML
jgi:hypothetical protein